MGVVFYEALSGAHPFRAPTLLGTTDSILHISPSPLEKTHAHIPAPLSRIVARMIAEEPWARYATADRLLEDLKNVRTMITSLPLPAQGAAKFRQAPPRGDSRRRVL